VRVLHVITGLAAGGAEQQLRLLLGHQHQATEIATLTNPGSVARAIRADGTVVHHVGMRGNTDVSVLPRLVRLIRAGRFDLVHTHLYRACVYGRAAARLAGVRHIVATEHSLGERYIEGRRVSPAVRRLYLACERLGQMTIAVSQVVARRLVAWGVPASRVEVIPNGIVSSRFAFDPVQRARLRARLGIAPGRFVVGSVGRLVPGKRIDLMLRAVHGYPGLTALVVGEGPQRPALSALAEDLDIDAIFVGERLDVPGLLSAMDVFVAPSAEETFGLGIVEALAAGLPVLYVACPALDDLPPGAVPGAHRLPVDPDALAPALAATVGNGAHRLSPAPALERYDMARIAARTNALYRRVTGMASPEHPNPPTMEESWPARPRH
jgi:glycosyltransferase involved in cell wall biosynthesis